MKYQGEELVPLLHRIGFEYKKTKQVSCKADPLAQAEFIEEFKELQLNRKEDEVHYFIDAVHPPAGTVKQVTAGLREAQNIKFRATADARGQTFWER